MMQVGRIEICGSVTLPHISIRYHQMPTDPATRAALSELALSILLSGPGMQVSRNDDLSPCFDLEEMQRRNQAVKRSNEKCS